MRQVILLRYFLAFSLILLSLSGSSQAPTYSFKQLSTVDGLSQSSVQCILQDKYGYMWFGTQDGLNRYDGYTFTVYRHINKDPNSLPANDIQVLFEDKNGDLWIGTRVGGLSKFNRALNKFTNYKHDKTKAGSLSNNIINSILQDAKGRLWIGTYKGLNLFNPKTERFKHYFTEGKTQKTSNINIKALHEDSRGNFWIGTKYGLYLFDRKSVKVKIYSNHPSKPNSLSNNVVWSIAEDNQKNLWIGTANGLNLFHPDSQNFSTYSLKGIAKDSYSTNNPIYAISASFDKKLWMATASSLRLFDLKNREFVDFTAHFKDGSQLSTTTVHTTYINRQGQLWAGFENTGINIYDSNLSYFPNYRINTKSNKQQNVIRGFAEDPKGNFWITSDAGLHYFDSQKKNFKTFNHNSQNRNSLISDFASVVLTSKTDSNIWIATIASGVDRYNPKTGVFKHYTSGEGQRNLSNNAIFALMEDKKGRIWMGSIARGLNVYDPKTDIITKYYHKPNDPTTICDSAILSLNEDKRGNIWMGGYYNGISIINPQSGKITHLNTRNSDLNSDVICSFHEDKKGNMWVGTSEGGLNVYNFKTKKFKSYTDNNSQLPNNVVYYITEDAKGYIWLTTNQGISRLDPKSETFRNYTVLNGLQDEEFNLSAGIRAKNGSILVGGINGFNMFNPLTLIENKNKPPVVLQGFEMFNKPVLSGAKDSILTKSLAETKEIILSYKQSFFSFEFVGLDYTAPQENQYAYMLEGFDKEWNYVGNQRKATYTNLDPGKYTFRVKASNNDGIWNEQGTSIEVIITPPYWMTWWFRALLLGSICGCIYAIYLYRVRLIKEKNTELEREVREQTAELRNQSKNLSTLNQELQVQSEELLYQAENLTSLNERLVAKELQERQLRALAEEARLEAEKANRSKSTFLATMSHEIRTPMNGVLGMASLLSETELDAEQKEYAEIIRTSGEALLYIINDILDFSKIESGKMEIDPHNFNLRKCIEEVLDLFAGKAGHAGLDLIYQIDSKIPAELFADSLRLRQILINLVGNAIKFTHEGEIFLNVEYLRQHPENELEISFKIRDTGIGIPEGKLHHLFEAFSQVDASTTRKYGGTGLGLAISKRLTSLMGGEISVESEAGLGTTFIFSIRCSEGIEIAHQDESLILKGCEGKRILLVDDNITHLKTMEAQLSKWKIDTKLAPSAEQALQLLDADSHFDLVITDMQMPKINGVELARRIKELRSSLPIILLSSVADEAAKKDSGLFVTVISKPVKQHHLFKAIKHQLIQSNSSTEQKKELIESRLSVEFAKAFPFKILVAEDNLINQKLIGMVLSKLGYQPSIVNNGLEVIEALNKENFDIIFMDMQMPEMDGIEASKTIRRNCQQQPLILAMTANAMTEDREQCLDAGMNDYISKPIKLEELMDKMKSMWGNSRNLRPS